MKLKTLVQQLLTSKIGSDHLVPSAIENTWGKWRNELPTLNHHLIPRYYFQNDVDISTTQLHGFCDISEITYVGVVYIQVTYTNHANHVLLVIAKTKMTPIKPLTIP